MAINRITDKDYQASLNLATDAEYIQALDANNNPIRIKKSDLATVLAGLSPLNAIEDGIFVMFHSKNNNYPQMVKPHKWTGYQNRGEIAEGVAVVEGGKILVVAPTESNTTLAWSSAAVNGGGKMTSDRVTMLDDWAGKENTASQIQHAECSSAIYAPGYCAAYSKTNANGNGLTAGKWWLPSMGEMMSIYANIQKINAALELINGAEKMVETAYWTSTERNTSSAWRLNLIDGHAYDITKDAYKIRVRAVSTFLD